MGQNGGHDRTIRQKIGLSGSDKFSVIVNSLNYDIEQSDRQAALGPKHPQQLRG